MTPDKTHIVNIDCDYLHGHAMALVTDTINDRIKNGLNVSFANISPTHSITSLEEALQFVRSLTDEEFRYYQFDARVTIILPDTNQAISISLDSTFNESKPSGIRYDDDENVDSDNTNIQVWGSSSLVSAVEKHKKQDKHDITIFWSFIDAHGSISDKKFRIKEANCVHDEYVPFIPGGVDAFISRYLKSKAPILILLGPPGTGKTSFIRHLLYTRRLNAAVTFEEKIMTNDAYYINYMSSSKSDIMVIEDADVILHSRSREDNKVMSKLLNVSDGLVPLLSKKIIFSTNLEEVDKIDSAIMRPGRCFDVIQFRPLDRNEAFAARKKAGLPPLDDGKREYVLSEIFNEEISLPETKRKIGII